MDWLSAYKIYLMLLVSRVITRVNSCPYTVDHARQRTRFIIGSWFLDVKYCKINIFTLVKGLVWGSVYFTPWSWLRAQHPKIITNRGAYSVKVWRIKYWQHKKFVKFVKFFSVKISCHTVIDINSVYMNKTNFWPDVYVICSDSNILWTFVQLKPNLDNQWFWLENVQCLTINDPC